MIRSSLHRAADWVRRTTAWSLLSASQRRAHSASTRSLLSVFGLLGVLILTSKPATAASNSLTVLAVGEDAWDELVDKIFNQLEEWLESQIGFGDAFEQLVGVLRQTLYTPLPPRSRAVLPSGVERDITIIPFDIWEPIMSLNQFFVELSFLILALYLAVLIGGLSIGFVSTSGCYKGIVKATIGMVLVPLNLELLGFILGIVRVLTRYIIPSPEQLFDVILGSLGQLLAAGPFGVIIGLFLMGVSVTLLLLLGCILVSRIVVVYFLCAFAPVIITTYILASHSSGARNVYDRLLGFTLPAVVFIIPLAVVFRMSAEILQLINPDPLSPESWFAFYIGVSTLLFGLVLLIMSTFVGRTIVKTTVKVGGAAAFAGGALALGGAGGAATGLRTRALAGNTAGALSAASQGVRDTQHPQRDSPMASSLLTKMPGVEEGNTPPDNIVDGMDYSDQGQQWSRERPRDRQRLQWDYNLTDSLTIDSEDDVVDYRPGSGSTGMSWSSVEKTGKNIGIRQHPKDPEKTVIQPHGSMDDDELTERLDATGFDADYSEEWGGYVTDQTVSDRHLNQLWGDDMGPGTDSIYVGRHAIAEGNVEGSRPPRRVDDDASGGRRRKKGETL